MFNKISQKQEMVSNIEQSNCDLIEGVLYEFPDSDISKLDKAEGYPNHYYRIKVTVVTKTAPRQRRQHTQRNKTKFSTDFTRQKSISATYLQEKTFFQRVFR